MPDYQLTISVIGKDFASGAFKNISRSLGRIGEVTMGMLLSRAIVGVSAQLVNLAGNAINATAQFQAMQVGLEGLMAREMSVMSGYAKTIAEVFPEARIQAKGLMDELARIAILSPYTVEATQQVFKMSMAFGFTSDQAKMMTAGLLNMAAGIGATDEMLQRMAYNLAQINLQGKVTKLDIRQLALAGLDLVSVLKYVGQQMGVQIESHLDFNKAIEEGTITWQDFAVNFQKYAETNFGGAAERMARTLMGLKSTWHDVWVLTLPKMLMRSAEAITAVLSNILNVFMLLRDTGHLDAIGEKWGRAVEKWAEPFGKFVSIIYDFIKVKTDMTDGLKYVAGELVGTAQIAMGATGIVQYAIERAFGPKAGKYFSTFRAGLGVMGKVFDFIKVRIMSFWTSVKKVFAALGTVWNALVVLWAGSGTELMDAFRRIGSALGFMSSSMQSGIVDTLVSALSRLSEWIISNQSAIVGFFTGIADFMEGPFTSAVQTVSRVWSKVMEAFQAGGVGGAITAIIDELTRLSPTVQEKFDSIVETLKVKGQEIWDVVQVKMVGAFQSLYAKLDEVSGGKLSTIVDTISDLVTKFSELKQAADDNKEGIGGVLTMLGGGAAGIAGLFGSLMSIGPVGKAVTGVTEVLKNFMVGMSSGMVILTQIGPVFGVIQAAVMALGAAVAPYLIPIVAVIAAIGLVIAAFVTNFAGFRDFVMNLWTEIQPLIQSIGELLQSVFVTIGTAVAVVWTSVVQPAFQVIAAVLQIVWAVIMQIVTALVGFLVPIFDGLSAILNSVVIPALKILGAVLTPIMQFISTLVIIILQLVRIAFQGLVAVINTYVLPLLTKLGAFLKEGLMVGFEKLVNFITQNFGPQLQWLNDKIITPLVNGFKWLVEKVQLAWEWLKKIADLLAKFKVPEDLSRHSPSPLELVFMNTAAYMENIATVQIPALRRGFVSLQNLNLGEPMAVTGYSRADTTESKATQVINVNVDHVSSEIDIYDMAYKVASVIRSA